MLSRVNGAVHTKHALCPRNFEVVGKGDAVMGETGAETSPGKRGHPLAPSTAVQIQAESRLPIAHVAPIRTRDVRNCRIAFEHRSEARLNGNANLQVGPCFVQKRNCGSGQDAIAQRAQTNDADPRPLRQLIKNRH